MSYTTIKKEDLIKKYSNVLRYICNNNQNDKLCNKLSYDKSGYCENCKNCENCKSINDSNNSNNEVLISKFKLNEYIITNEIKFYLDKFTNNTGKNDDETLKDFRIKLSINIFDILYHNIFFSLTNAKFLVTVINKISELLKTDRDIISDYCDKNKYKKYVFNFMTDIDNFVKKYEKKNKYLINTDLSIENFESFMNKFIMFIENYYDNIILQNKKRDSINNINIDINNFDNFQIVLDL